MRFHERSSLDKLRERCDETVLLADAAAAAAAAAAAGITNEADAHDCDDGAGLMQRTIL